MKGNLENLGYWPLNSYDENYLTDFDFKSVLFFNEYNMSNLNVYKIKSVQIYILYVFTLINDSSKFIPYIIKILLSVTVLFSKLTENNEYGWGIPSV